MASSLLHVIALTLSILMSVACLIKADFPKKKLDCSGIISNFPLAQFELYCDAIVNPVDDPYTLMNRMDIVEMCTCALLRRTMVFEAMITHELEFIYLSSKKLMETTPINQEIGPDNLVLVNNPDGIMDFWDRFSQLLRSVNPGGKEGLNLSNKFLDYYTNNYYKPDEFKIAYKGEGQTANFRKELSGACNQLSKSFSPFIYLFNNLRLMSENPRFVYRILTYNENLYKVMIGIKMCKFLSGAGIVTEPAK